MTTSYFAYGSNMDTEQMHQRCPDALLAGTAILPGYLFIINHRGLATIVPHADASVAGVLWELSPADELALDRYEGYGLGLYDKCFRTVENGDANTLQVLVYIDHINTRLGASRQGYLTRILRAAEAHGLSQRHLDMLRIWPANSSFHTFNRLMNDIKSGAGLPDSIKWQDRHRLSREMKELRDKVMLDAIFQGAGLNAEEYDFLLEETVCSRARDLSYQYEMERTTSLVVDYVGLTRFLRHIESLKQKENLVDELRVPGSTNEVAGLGVIITNDPAREHGPEHRFIVVEHAPILANLWRRLFFQEHGISPRTCNFMEAFADVAENCEGKSPQDVVAQILAAVQELAVNTHHGIEEDLESIRI